ncbi:sugar phosphate isomerase/epimerase family protein [Actinomadura decatromicini]|uniref:Sugar phosphate isomerase/epimerase n=1 Tax=Actinomadura decatromicini TaxID=2604572 RepID=A0A5D3FZE6_9ACTN|nr:sugar phosphate isomerase/epimerase family protein [Actinomadura decatromicini]TYK53412.1 sugar phosphate isomerase/epimerase [Actinomadura decatromicini]
MKVGIDGRKVPGAAGRPAIERLDLAKDLGLDGVFYRTVFDMDPGLDAGRLAEYRRRADALGLYLEAGVGNVNPYAMAEHPHLRRAGDGDTVLGFRRAIEAAAGIGCRELWVVTGGFKDHPGRFAYDRFRSDADWPDQLAETARFLELLAPVCREHGVHLNLETHEEITSFELVRLVERVGADVLGITYDTTNLLQRGEDPLESARRVAPHVRQTHIKDCLLGNRTDGMRYQLRPVGSGLLDLAAILRSLRDAGARPNLSLETLTSAAESGGGEDGPHPYLRPLTIELYDPAWHAMHPDLTSTELAAVVRLAAEGDRRVAEGAAESMPAFAGRPFTHADAVAFVQAGAAHLRSLASLGGVPCAM